MCTSLDCNTLLTRTGIPDIRKRDTFTGMLLTLVASLNQNCLSSFAGSVCKSLLAAVELSDPASAARIDLSTGSDMPTSARKTVPSGALNIKTGPAACWPSDIGVAEESKAILPNVMATFPLQVHAQM